MILGVYLYPINNTPIADEAAQHLSENADGLGC